MKIAKTLEEQITILEGRGMSIEDKNKAYESLLDIGYYRIGFYAFPFEKTYPSLKNRNHQYVADTHFSDVVALYYFDTDLRNDLIYYLTRVEICLRTYLTYNASNLYKVDPWWFVNKKYVRSEYIDSFDKTYRDVKKNIAIQRHHQKYHDDKYAPAWKTLEFMTFGNILALYDGLLDRNLKTNIANHFGCRNVDVFRNYMDTLRILRNACAHGACIYNIKLSKSIKSGPAGDFHVNDRHNIKGILDVLLYIIGTISVNRKKDLYYKVKSIIMSSRSVMLDDIIKKSSGLDIKR